MNVEDGAEGSGCKDDWLPVTRGGGSQDSHGLPPIPPFPPVYSPPEQPMTAKEVVLVFLALMLLVCSILLFFRHWKKNYHDINQLPYYAYLYQSDEEDFTGRNSTVPITSAAIASLYRSNTNLNKSPGSIPDDKEFVRTGNMIPRSQSMQLRYSTSPSGPVMGNNGKTITRAGTEGTVFAGVLRKSPGTVGMKISATSMRPRPRNLPPKRASSDVHWRFQRCRVDVLRKVQNGHDTPSDVLILGKREALDRTSSIEEEHKVVGEILRRNMSEEPGAKYVDGDAADAHDHAVLDVAQTASGQNQTSSSLEGLNKEKSFDVGGHKIEVDAFTVHPEPRGHHGFAANNHKDVMKSLTKNNVLLSRQHDDDKEMVLMSSATKTKTSHSGSRSSSDRFGGHSVITTDV